ncbi:hypothetical protein LIA77_05188 [Sarocladium implicatum]|nr:hypothetical protein LIA77_05188 [Sarocladium implicatum]
MTNLRVLIFQPNITEYTLTLPYFICQEWGNQCADGCNGNNACISSCREDNPCGASDPTQVNATETSTGTTKPTASSTDDEDDEDAIFTGAPGSSDDDEDDDADAGKTKSKDDDDEDSPRTNEPGAASALALGNAYGLAVVMGGLFAGFAFL